MTGVRPTDEADFAALGRVAYATGFFGASAARFFADPGLFADLWVGPYLGAAGCCNYLALVEGEPVGYILGSCDLQAYRRDMLFHQLPAALRGWLVGRYPRARASFPYLLRLARYPSRDAPADAYPAQLHLNVLSDARGQRLGTELLETFLACLTDRGVRGVQLSTTEKNAAALALYEKFGFRVYVEYRSPLWQPYVGRALKHVVMVRRL
jgi:ribosomal protein S18 acetylase RimI-like enzyme